MIRLDLRVSISRFCAILGIPRRTYTRWRRPTDVPDITRQEP